MTPKSPTLEATPTASDSTPMYTAGEVEARTGIAAATLRQWERRYGLPRPERAPSGYRLYSQADIECVGFLKDRIAEGVPPSRAAQLFELERRPVLAPPGSPALPAEGAELVERLVAAMVAGEFGLADAVLAAAHASLPVEGVLVSVIGPALVAVGERWHRGEITAAHEHQASAYVRGKLHALLELAGSPRHGPAVVLACAPGEWHELGPLVLAIFLRRAGLRTHYVGASTPVPDLVRYALSVPAAAVLVSASTIATVEELRPQAGELRTAAPLLAFGGMAFNENPGLAAELGGVYLGAGAPEALETLLGRLDL